MFLELWISTKDVYRLLTLGLLSVNVRVILSVELSRERLASAFLSGSLSQSVVESTANT